MVRLLNVSRTLFLMARGDAAVIYAASKSCHIFEMFLIFVRHVWSDSVYYTKNKKIIKKTFEFQRIVEAQASLSYNELIIFT